MSAYQLVPHRTDNGRGYVVERTNDGQRLHWRTVPLKTRLFPINIVGESRRLFELRDPSFGAGAQLSLKPEPDNPYDPDAVSVWNADRSLQAGYIPAEEAARVGQLILDWNPTAFVMWESFDEGGRRVALRILLVAEDADVEWR